MLCRGLEVGQKKDTIYIGMMDSYLLPLSCCEV